MKNQFSGLIKNLRSQEEIMKEIVMEFRYEGSILPRPKPEDFFLNLNSIDQQLQPLFEKYFGIPIKDKRLLEIREAGGEWPEWVVMK